MKEGSDSRSYTFSYFAGKVGLPCLVEHQYRNHGTPSVAMITLDFPKMELSRGARAEGNLYRKVFEESVEGKNRQEVRESARGIARTGGIVVLRHLREKGKLVF